ncbi:MAG: CBS domain-containing protein [Nitrospinae bacterium]|nr:CBS domain-containing protein [Nitrospinota bacterium]
MSKIGDYMSTPVLTISPDTFAFDAIGKMFENEVGALLVEKNGEYIGIFSKIDWLHLVLRGESNPNVVKVSSIISSPIITVDKNETLAKASNLIEENNIRHIAVTEDGKIIGMLSVKDLEKYYHQLHEKGVLFPEISGH